MAHEDKRYTDFVKRRPCCACGKAGGDAHHKVGAGMGLRSHDSTCVPLCRGCHDDAHALRGLFRGWSREKMSEWHDRKAAACRVLFKQMEDCDAF